MIISSLSASSYKTWDFCQFQWFLKYVCRFPDLEMKSAMLGHVVHSVCEAITGARILNRPKNSVRWDSHQLWDIYKGYYSDKHPETASKLTAKDWRDMKGHMDVFLKTEKSPYFGNPVSKEERFSFPVTKGSESFNLIGYIDRIDRIDDNTIEIIDYKTGRRSDLGSDDKLEYEDLMQQMQLKLYHFAGKVLYPDIENILVTVIYIKDGGPFTCFFGKETIEETKLKLWQRFDDIIKHNSPSRSLGWWCKYMCPYGSKTGICDRVWQEQKTTDISVLGEMYNALNSTRKSGR